MPSLITLPTRGEPSRASTPKPWPPRTSTPRPLGMWAGNRSLFLYVDDVLRILYWAYRDQRSDAEKHQMLDLIGSIDARPPLQGLVPLKGIGVTTDESVSFLGSTRLGPGPYSYRVCKLRKHFFKLPNQFLGGQEFFVYSVELLPVVPRGTPNALPELSCTGLFKLLRPLDGGHDEITRGFWKAAPRKVSLITTSEGLSEYRKAATILFEERKVRNVVGRSGGCVFCRLLWANTAAALVFAFTWQLVQPLDCWPYELIKTHRWVQNWEWISERSRKRGRNQDLMTHLRHHREPCSLCSTRTAGRCISCKTYLCHGCFYEYHVKMFRESFLWCDPWGDSQ